MPSLMTRTGSMMPHEFLADCSAIPAGQQLPDRTFTLSSPSHEFSTIMPHKNSDVRNNKSRDSSFEPAMVDEGPQASPIGIYCSAACSNGCKASMTRKQ